MKVWVSARQAPATDGFLHAHGQLAGDCAVLERAAEATLWVVDGVDGKPDASLRTLYEQATPRPAVAYLGRWMSDLPHPAWAFFKAPLTDPKLISLWLHSANVQPGSRADAGLGTEPWRWQPMRLSAWPNLARFRRDLHVITACAQLLRAPTLYSDLIARGAQRDAIDALLADAWAAGLLQLLPVPAAAGVAAAPATAKPAESPTENARRGLVSRLLARFSLR